jgi:hypothetical protein
VSNWETRRSPRRRTPPAAGSGRAPSEKKEGDEKREVDEERDDHGGDRLLARKAVAQPKYQAESESEDEGLAAEGQGSDGVEPEAGDEGGGQAGAGRQTQGGIRDEQAG